LIQPARTLQGSLVVPGDKSISHRYAMLAGLAEGVSRLSNFSTGADPASSLACMVALGAKVEDKGTHLEVTGTAGDLREPTGELDCGNSGSTMRMLAGMIAPHAGRFTLVGDESLTVRPMERIRRPLKAMGARVELTEGHAPMRVEGAALKGMEFAEPIQSAQVKTAILFAGLQAVGTTTLIETVRTRDHTEQALRAFGARLARTHAADGNSSRLQIEGEQGLKALEATVPGDLSSAAFFLAATLLFPDANLILDAIGLNPTRTALLDVIAALGAKLRVLSVEEQHGELIGTVQVTRARPASTQPFVIEGALTAQLIDELPVLAAVAPYTQAGIIVRDAQELRVKESDRIALVVKNLRAMGADVTEREDGMEIPGGQTLHGAEIDSGGDHRIAMAFAAAGFFGDGDSGRGGCGDFFPGVLRASSDALSGLMRLGRELGQTRIWFGNDSREA